MKSFLLFSALALLSVALAPNGRSPFRGPLQTGGRQASKEQLPNNLDPRRNIGAMSCSAVSCHGRGRPDSATTPVHDPASGRDRIPIRFDELHTWLRDPHSKAHQVLEDGLSRQMFANLGIAADQQVPSNRDYRAIREKCLACHGVRYTPPPRAPSANGPTSDPPAAPSIVETHLEGVSCEACHGGANRWRSSHYQPGFLNQSTEARSKLGFDDTSDLWTRARKCAACHVGSVGRSVDHDLIAAGHPQMLFEFSSYFHQLPKHWKPERDLAAHGGRTTFPVEIWLVGQMVVAETALEQLRHRAASGEEVVWPEFAEHRCFACHQDVITARGDKHTPIARKTSARQLTNPFNDWHVRLLETYAAQTDSKLAKKFAFELAQVRREMEDAVVPVRTGVAHKSRQAVAALRTWADRMGKEQAELTSGDLRNSVIDLVTHSLTTADSWTESLQLFNALAAVAASVELEKPDSRSELQPLLQDLRRKLKHQVGWSSPRQFDQNKRSILTSLKSLANQLRILSSR